MSNIFSRWTDDNLLYVLAHTNGDFSMAVNTIIRHEATGRPPAEVIQSLWLSARERQYFEGCSSPRMRIRRRSYSYSESESNQSQSIPNSNAVIVDRGNEPRSTALHRIRREQSYVGSVRSLLEGEPQQQQNLSLPDSHDMVSLDVDLNTNTGAWAIPAFSPSPSSSTDAVNHSTPRTQEGIMDMNQSLSESRHGHIDEEAEPKAKASEESKHEQMLNMHMQSGTEASLKVKETRNPSETDADIDDEALAYAVKAIKETFDEEHRNQEVRNALERRIFNISLAASLADPVKKSEEELVDEALKRSLTDPVPKSEERLFEEARKHSLDDMERLEVITKAEEEMVEEAKLKSLHTMSKEEELIEAVKRQSLLSDSSSVGVGKKPAPAYSYWPSNNDQQQSTSISTPRPLPQGLGLGLAEKDSSDCSTSSVDMEHPPPPLPSIDDSSLMNMFGVDLMDRKIPALALAPPTAQKCINDVKRSSSFSNPSLNPNVASAEDAISSSASVSSDQEEDENESRSGANTDAAPSM